MTAEPSRPEAPQGREHDTILGPDIGDRTRAATSLPSWLQRIIDVKNAFATAIHGLLGRHVPPDQGNDPMPESAEVARIPKVRLRRTEGGKLILDEGQEI